MISDYNKLTGLQKTATLFSVLGESLALTLIQGLSKTDIRKIRATIRELDEIAFSVKKRVIEEFYFSFVSEKFQSVDSDELKNPFEFISQLTDEQLIALLITEKPRIIAIALAQIPAERRTLVMDRLKAEDKGRILIEMGNLKDIPLEGIVNIANDLKKRSQFLPKTLQFSRGGGKEIAEVLSNMDLDDEKQFMDSITKENPELALEVKKHHLAFDDIFEVFPDNLMRDLMNSIPDIETVAMALKGLPEETVNRVIETLPKRKQAMFEPIEGAVPKREINKAKKVVIDQARQMEKDGVYHLEDLLSSGEMVE